MAEVQNTQEEIKYYIKPGDGYYACRGRQAYVFSIQFKQWIPIDDRMMQIKLQREYDSLTLAQLQEATKKYVELTIPPLTTCIH